MTAKQEEILLEAYQDFNDRNIPGVLEHFHPGVMWARAWQGGHVEGHKAVEEYWTSQWQELDPVVEPVAFDEREGGQIAVTVHQVVHDKNGQLLFDGTVLHVYTFEGDKIKRMDIEKA